MSEHSTPSRRQTESHRSPQNTPEPHQNDSQSAELPQPLSSVLSAADVLRLQSVVGNQALLRMIQRETVGGNAPAAPTRPPRPEIGSDIEGRMDRDVDWMVEKLKEWRFDAGEQAEAIARIRAYQEMDRQFAAATPGYEGTDYLDKILFKLKMRSFNDDTWSTFGIEKFQLTYDALWRQLDDDAKAQFSALVAQSKTQATNGPLSAEQKGFWETLGKQEAMGMWGMLKGLGTGLAGVADTGAAGLNNLLKLAGVDTADPIKLAEILGKQFDESGEIMFGKEFKEGEGLIMGLNAADIGTGGGTIISQLVLMGAAPGSGWAKGAKAGIDITSGLGGIVDAGKKIAETIARLQEQGNLSAEALLGDAAFMQACSALLLNIATVMSTGKKLDPSIAPALEQSLGRLSAYVTGAQAVGTIEKISQIANSDKMSAAERDKATAQAVIELIGQGVSIAADVAGHKQIGGDPTEAAQRADPNLKEFDTQADQLDRPVLDENRSWQKNAPDVESFDPNLKDFGADAHQSSGPELDESRSWQKQGAPTPESQDPNLKTLPPAEADAKPLELDRRDWTKRRKTPDTAEPTQETGLGSPGTGPEGQSARSTGMNVNTYDAAEVGLGQRRDFRYSPEHGGYTYLQSVEFDVPANVGNKGTRKDSFHGDEMVDATGVDYARSSDYTNSGRDRAHGTQQSLSGGDPDIAHALDTVTNIWPGNPQSNQQGAFRAAENAYTNIKQEHPEAHVRVRIEATFANPPRMLQGASGRQVAIPESFTFTFTVEGAEKPVTQPTKLVVPNP